MESQHSSWNILMGVGVGAVLGASAVQYLPSVQAAPPARTATAELEFGGPVLRPGMAKSQVITKLSKDFVLENSGDQVQGAEFCFVKAKGEPPSSVGSLQFRSELLVDATREWDQIEPDIRSLGFMKSVYGAVDRVFGSGKTGQVKCTLKREPGSEHYQVNLVTSSRIVSFAIIERKNSSGDPYRWAFVSESVYR